MKANGQVMSVEKGGPSRVWTAILSRAELRKKKKETWRLIPLEENAGDVDAFHQLYIDRKIPQEVVKDAFPDHWAALTWFMADFQTSLRWPLEAWLLAGLSSMDAAKKIDPGCPALAVDIYRRAFFAVDEDRRSNPGWMFRYIWGPGMAHRSGRYYYDFFFKAVAFYKGPESLERVLSGDALDPSTSSVLRDFAMGLRDRLVLTDINVRNTLSSSERAPLVENAVAVWKGEQPPIPQTNPALEQLASAVKSMVGVVLPEAGYEETYEFSSEKYKD